MVSNMVSIFLLAALQSAPATAICPTHDMHTDVRQAGVEKRGDAAMGFSHALTTHHFRLYTDGGAIEATADDAKDLESVQAIAAHLKHVIGMFSSGDFSVPMFIHGENPPGAAVMKERRDRITYALETIPGGARIRIKTQDAEALRAIHAFLRFQIADHHTGDAHTGDATDH
jgi:hypothetical protein